MNPQDFDPDEFVLTKNDVTDFISIVMQYWGRTLKDKVKNAKLISGLQFMKAGVIFTSEDDFKTIWSMMITFIMNLQFENAMQKALQDGDKWGQTLIKIKLDLKNGGLEKMLEKFQK